MDIGWKIAQGAAIVVAGLVSDNIVDLGWKIFTGHKPPRDAEDEARIAEVLVFAVISGVIVALAQRFAVRKAAAWYGDRKPEKV
ncbi:MAG: DUF4235 domain-containing protein [Actinomycetaceae bacterium]|nr:DUF4235 domain-containing protein [Actinomycetaceae bacterium]